MANLTCMRQDQPLLLRSQDFSLTLRDTWANQKGLFIFLRALRVPETGKPLFTYQHLAEAFGYPSRQNIQNFWQECEHSGQDVLAYLQRKRNVDATVVAAVQEELRHTPLASETELCARVSERLRRPDLTVGTMQTA